MSETVTLELIEDGVVLLTLQDEAHQNAFTPPFVDLLVARIRELGEISAARVAILRGLPSVFCAGAHESLLEGLAQGEHAASDIVLSRELLDLPIPAIAAMEGHAVGGGLAFGLCCDVVLMARESRYGCTFMNMGFTPGMGTTRLLQDAVGHHVAAEMMFGGQLFKGSHFERRSAVNHVLPREQIYPRALSIARRFADKPRFALELLKRHLSLPRRRAFEEARTVETFMHQISFGQAETLERIRATYIGADDDGEEP